MRTLKAVLLAVSLVAPLTLSAATATLLGWNNLGMHCMDSDYSVFSVLPPYNTIEAQLVVGGKLVTNGAGYTVTYEAVADPSGSLNTTSIGKGNWESFYNLLYTTNTLSPDAGLAGWNMPGPGNVRQTNLFQTLNQPVAGVFTPVNWWHAEGIPITPFDDAMRKNAYPLMRMIAWNSLDQPIATNDIVLPVSDEMDCRACHASGTRVSAEPVGGWAWDGLPERDFRLNILLLHDELKFSDFEGLYTEALAARGFNPQGLYYHVVADGKPVLCAACHASEALGAPSYGTIPPLTTSMHWFHAHVTDPIANTALDNVANRTACYRCHPGSATRCLRGAMGAAVAADGTMEMQCQSCHGTMSEVGSFDRVGWIMEPTCQACHVGTATNNPIRYTSAFDTPGHLRVPTDQTFATTPNTPPTGPPSLNLSLYRFSVGHGGLQCSACHGSTHAEFPASHANDNLRNLRLQGHAGMVSECTACHTNSPSTVTGGPHGMHPVGQTWVGGHQGAAESNSTRCQVCHGTDYRGSVLARMLATRTVSGQTLFQGAMVSCYNCHNGPSGDGSPPAAPTAAGVVTNTTNDKSVDILLPLTGVGAYPRIITQTTNGTVGLNANTHVATYFPNPGFVGTDRFTFAAYDGSRNSALAIGTVTVAQGPFSLGAVAYVPPSYPALWPVAFAVVPSVTNSAAAVTFDWSFGDGTPHSSSQYATHAYAVPGSYQWTVTATVSGVSASVGGNIAITGPVVLQTALAGSLLTLAWPNTLSDMLLEVSPALGPSARWRWVTNVPAYTPATVSVTLPAPAPGFYRVRRPW